MAFENDRVPQTLGRPESGRGSGVIAGVACAAVLTALLFVLLFLSVMRVQGTSMEPAVPPGSILIVNRWAFGPSLPFSSAALLFWRRPHRGDLVVLRNPVDHVLVVKRCVGLEGDRVTVDNKTMHIGQLAFAITGAEQRRFEGVSAVPKNTVFVLGDNRAVSEDSRDYGFVPIADLVGTVVVAIPPMHAFPLTRNRAGS